MNNTRKEGNLHVDFCDRVYKVNQTALSASRQTKVQIFLLLLDIAVYFLSKTVNSRALRLSVLI